MGIKELDKNLHSLNLIKTVKYEEKYNKMLYILGFPEIKNFNYHFDFSILVYKTVLTSESFKDMLSKIEKIIINCKNNNNNIYIYTDPEQILEKKTFMLKDIK